MAVAVPLIMSATGASAAIGAAIGLSATAVTFGTGLLMAATGINDKINKAASKVFGEDVVKIGNIAGAAFMAWDAFSGAPASAAQAGTEAAAETFDAAGPFTLEGGAAGAPLGAEVMPQLGTSEIGSGLNLGQLAEPGGALARAAGAAAPGSIISDTGSIIDTVKRGAQTVAEKWSSASPSTKGALLQVGGNLLSGYGQAKAADKRQREAEQNEARYRTGSGLPYWAKERS